MVVVAEEIVVEVLVAKQENIGLSVGSVKEVPYVLYVIVFMDIVSLVMEPVKYTTANGILYFQTFVHHATATENVKRVMAQVIAKSVEVKVDGMNIKKAISMVRGVGKITLPRRRKLYSSYELSLRDLDEGRVYKYDSLDDLIKEIEG